VPHSYEIRLVVNRDGESYTAHWIEPNSQESEPFPLELPMTADDMEELRWYLEIYTQFTGAGDRARAKKIEAQLNTWGSALFNAIFGSDDGRDVYRNLLDATRGDDLCLLTIGATDPDILAQPWEMMRDRRGPLCLRGVTIRRQLRGQRNAVSHQLGLPLRVLLIVSRPQDIGFIDPRTSVAPVLKALEGLPAGQVTVDFCDPPTLTQLEELISEARTKNTPFHIVHFDGHGTYLPRTGVGALAFEDSDAKTHLVTGSELGELLARLDVPLVLLEACRSADLSDKPVFGSVAPALLQNGVGSVIAFSHAVHIQAAQLLVERFYQRLAGGLTIGQALEEARSRLRTDRARWLHLGPNADTVDLHDWFIPQLYQVGADLALTTETSTMDADARPAPSRHRLKDFPPPPMYRFQGRAMELLEIQRAFRRYPAVLLSGMGGMGKTALAREAAYWWLRTRHFETAVFCSFETKAGAERVVQLIGGALEGEDFSNRLADAQWEAAVGRA